MPVEDFAEFLIRAMPDFMSAARKLGARVK